MNVPLKKILLPVNQAEWEKITASQDDYELTMSLSLAAGAVLDYLERNGQARLWEMSLDIKEWPAVLIIMSVGVLVRERLVRVRKRHRGIIVELVNFNPSEIRKKRGSIGPFWQ